MATLNTPVRVNAVRQAAVARPVRAARAVVVAPMASLSRRDALGALIIGAASLVLSKEAMASSISITGARSAPIRRWS